MIRTASIAFLAALALLAGMPAAAQEGGECSILSPTQLDKIFPQHAPWGVMSGGLGRCKFHSDESVAPIVHVSIMQDVKDSPAAAEDGIRKTRANAEKEGHIVESLPSLGKHAFSYRPSFAGAEGSMNLMAQSKNVIVVVLLSVHKPAYPTYVQGAIEVARAGFAIGGDAAAQRAVTDCPWFVTATLKKLLPGEGFEAQSYGENSCMAQAQGAAVIATIMPASDSDLLQNSTGGGCTSEPVAALGAKGLMRYACEGGRPQARVSMVAGSHYVEYAYAPGREPTVAERALLVEMAKASQAGAR